MALFHQPFIQLEETEMLSLFRLLRNQRTRSVIVRQGTECRPGVLWEQRAGMWGWAQEMLPQDLSKTLFEAQVGPEQDCGSQLALTGRSPPVTVPARMIHEGPFT